MDANTLAAALPIATAAGAAAGRWLRSQLLRAQRQRIEDLEEQRAQSDAAHSAALDALRNQRIEMERRLETVEAARRERDAVCRECPCLDRCQWRANLEATGRDITGQVPRALVAAVVADNEKGNLR